MFLKVIPGQFFEMISFRNEKKTHPETLTKLGLIVVSMIHWKWLVRAQASCDIEQ